MATRVSNYPLVQDRVIVLVSEEESAGELFRFEYVAREVTPPPTDHVHTEQEERVEVLEGTLRCRVAGVERVLCPGEKMVIDTKGFSLTQRAACLMPFGTKTRWAPAPSESTGLLSMRSGCSEPTSSRHDPARGHRAMHGSAGPEFIAPIARVLTSAS